MTTGYVRRRRNPGRRTAQICARRWRTGLCRRLNCHRTLNPCACERSAHYWRLPDTRRPQPVQRTPLRRPRPAFRGRDSIPSYTSSEVWNNLRPQTNSGFYTIGNKRMIAIFQARSILLQKLLRGHIPELRPRLGKSNQINSSFFLLLNRRVESPYARSFPCVTSSRQATLTLIPRTTAAKPCSRSLLRRHNENGIKRVIPVQRMH